MSLRRFTVLQVLPALTAGGVERGTLEVAACLVAQGHRSLVMSAGGRMVPALEAAGSEHFTWLVGHKSLWTLRLIPRLRQFLQQQQVDIVHVRSRFPAWIVYLAWRGMPAQRRPRLVTTVHGCYRPGAYSRIMTCGERVIVISRMIHDYVTQQYAVSAQKLRLIYRGVDGRQYYPGYQPTTDWLQAWYQALPSTRDKRLLLLPARLTRWKGHEDFIRMLQVVCEVHPEVHALIVGEVDARKQYYRQALEQQLLAAGLQGRVTFIGHRQDIRDIMAISTIVYSLSLQPEAFGRVALEALSLGVPVIGYAHGGVAEQLAALLPAGAVEVGDDAQVTRLTLAWLQQPPVVAPNRQFQLAHMLHATLQVYEDVLRLPRA